MSQITRIAVVGSRTAEVSLVRACLEQSYPEIRFSEGVEIVTGDAQGTDRAAREFASNYEIPYKVFRADWDRHGKGAGMIRNSEIVAYCTYCIAFWDGQSRGTLDTITKTVRAGKYVEIISLVNMAERMKA